MILKLIFFVQNINNRFVFIVQHLNIRMLYHRVYIITLNSYKLFKNDVLIFILVTIHKFNEFQLKAFLALLLHDHLDNILLRIV